jgi:hypothetical protein
MPITNTLETTRKLEAVGFDPKQADTLSELFETTAHAVSQDLKDFIVQQLAAQDQRWETRLDSRIAQLESRLLREMRQQVVWIFGVLIAVATVYLAAAKVLF